MEDAATMMAVVKTRAGRGYDYVRVPRPEPRPDEVLLRIERAAICGTDVLVHKWDPLAQELIQGLPFIPGHECSAQVVDVGDDVAGISVGARVCAETHIPCGTCYQCTHGLQHICKNLVLFGHRVDGCFAEYAVIPARSVYPLRTDLRPELACLLEPFGVSLRGVQEVAPEGDTLLVNGCGPIGVFAIAIARHAGAKKILAAELHPMRLSLARAMGAEVAIDLNEVDLRQAVLNETEGDGAGCIIEASGAAGAVTACLGCLRKGGRIVVLGNPKGSVEIRDVMPDLMHKELTLKTLHGRRMYGTWEHAEALLASGATDISPVITHTFPMSRVDEAMETILRGEACKVELEPGR